MSYTHSNIGYDNFVYKEICVSFKGFEPP